MGRFLYTYHLPKLSHNAAENLNKSVTRTGMKPVTKALPIKKSPGTDIFIGEFYKAF